MKNPYSLSDDELKNYSFDHLKYEIEMLLWSAGILCTLSNFKDEGSIATALNNSVFESFAAHSRNLIMFLYSRSLKKDFQSDIVVEDYISDESLKDTIPKISNHLSEVLVRANKQVSHLTKERIDFERQGKEWKFLEITNDIMTLFRKISPIFPISRVDVKLLSLISKCEISLPLTKTQVKTDTSGNVFSVEFIMGEVT